MTLGTTCKFLAALVLTGLSLSALADVKENPYQVIIDRNPFALKPIPPPPAPDTNPVTNAPPPVEVKLTGISTLLGTPKVFLQFLNQQTKKTDFPPGMMVGERQGDIEIVAVDPDAGTVRIRQGDAETTLDFTNNGVKPTGVAAAVPAPPAPGVMPLNPTMPGPGGLAGTYPGAPSANGRAIIAGNNAVGANPAGANGLPSRPLRADNVIVSGYGQSANGAAPPPAAMAHPTLSADDAAARIEAQRQILEQREREGLAPPGLSKILPPTRFSPPAAPPGPAQ